MLITSKILNKPYIFDVILHDILQGAKPLFSEDRGVPHGSTSNHDWWGSCCFLEGLNVCIFFDEVMRSSICYYWNGDCFRYGLDHITVDRVLRPLLLLPFQQTRKKEKKKKKTRPKISCGIYRSLNHSRHDTRIIGIYLFQLIYFIYLIF